MSEANREAKSSEWAYSICILQDVKIVVYTLELAKTRDGELNDIIKDKAQNGYNSTERQEWFTPKGLVAIKKHTKGSYKSRDGHGRKKRT